MQIIYICTSGGKYLRFHSRNVKARNIFASCKPHSQVTLYKDSVLVQFQRPNLAGVKVGYISHLILSVLFYGNTLTFCNRH